MTETTRTPLEEILAAEQLLKNTGISVLEAATLVHHLYTAGGQRSLRAMQKCVIRGVEALEHEDRTVSFQEAVDETLRAKAHLRPTSLRDIRYFAQRMMLRVSGLERRMVRQMDSHFCQEVVEQSFSTPRQKFKARAILSGIMTVAFKRGWCHENPVLRIDSPPMREHEIRPLEASDIQALLHQAKTMFDQSCLAAVGLMLYAGIRPHELERLRWKNINLNTKTILIASSHSKTGGCRIVSIHPVLRNLLRSCPPAAPDTPICPTGWRRKWTQLHHAAGWDGVSKKWQADSLRHTFATYHACYYRNLTDLQMEMGHSSLKLLQYRYLNMNHRSKKDAKQFWHPQPTPSLQGKVLH